MLTSSLTGGLAVAKRIDGRIVQLGPTRRRRGNLEFETIEFCDASGQTIVWKKTKMQRETFDRLRIGADGRFYVSNDFSTLYGLRWPGEAGHFSWFSANFMVLVMCVGMIFLGLATSMFLFPFLVALAGFAGIFECLAARRARSQFRKDEEQMLREAARAPRG
jgi:hypothetical protein